MPEPDDKGPAADEEFRVLLLPSTQRDAEAIRAVCESSGIAVAFLPSMSKVCEALEAGAGALVVSEEALTADPAELLDFVKRQPVWADLPIIVLSRPGSESSPLAQVLDQIGNVSVVERPVRISTFLSLVKVALRGRERQYEVRKHVLQLRAVEEERTALWNSERSAPPTFMR